jgi:hypothetical protein
MKMKNSINIFSILLVFVLSTFCMTKLLAQEKQKMNDISQIAEKDFKVFLEKIPVGLEANYGFSNRNEFEKASVGKPISVFFPTDFFYISDLIDSSKVNYEVSQIWEVPVLVNGNICCLLRMKVTDNNCAIIGIGGYLTAIEIDKLSKTIGLNKEKDRSLLKFPDIESQYLVVYDNSISYRNSKCYRIGKDEESGKSEEFALLNVLITSKQLIKERKDLGNEK